VQLKARDSFLPLRVFPFKHTALDQGAPHIFFSFSFSLMWRVALSPLPSADIYSVCASVLPPFLQRMETGFSRFPPLFVSSLFSGKVEIRDSPPSSTVCFFSDDDVVAFRFSRFDRIPLSLLGDRPTLTRPRFPIASQIPAP